MHASYRGICQSNEQFHLCISIIHVFCFIFLTNVSVFCTTENLVPCSILLDSFLLDIQPCKVANWRTYYVCTYDVMYIDSAIYSLVVRRS